MCLSGTYLGIVTHDLPHLVDMVVQHFPMCKSLRMKYCQIPNGQDHVIPPSRSTTCAIEDHAVVSCRSDSVLLHSFLSCTTCPAVWPWSSSIWWRGVLGLRRWAGLANGSVNGVQQEKWWARSEWRLKRPCLLNPPGTTQTSSSTCRRWGPSSSLSQPPAKPGANLAAVCRPLSKLLKARWTAQLNPGWTMLPWRVRN